MRARRVCLAWVVVLALAGCNSDVTGRGAIAGTVTPQAPPSAADGAAAEQVTAGTDFTVGLLPAGQFGQGAYSEPFGASELAERDPRRLPAGATVSPSGCGEPGDEAEAEPESFAGQVVLVDTGLTYFQMVQAPYEGGGLDPALPEAGINGCESVTMTLPNGTVIAMAVTALDIGVVGDTRAGLRIDRTAVSPDGQVFTSYLLLAYVADGDRMTSLAVTSLVPDRPVDEASFRRLVVTAFEHQHAALG